MAKAEKSSGSQREANGQEVNRKKLDEVTLAAVERMNEKMKGVGWKAPPKRGDVKKSIVKDFGDSLKALADRTMKSSYTARVHDESVSFTEDSE